MKPQKFFAVSSSECDISRQPTFWLPRDIFSLRDVMEDKCEVDILTILLTTIAMKNLQALSSIPNNELKRSINI